MAFVIFVLFLVGVGIILSLSAHLFWHSTSRLMFAVGAVASLSAYVFSIASNNGIPWPISVGLATGGGIVAGVLVALAGHRLRAEEFLLLALGLSELIRRLLFHAEPLTGGAYGIRFRTGAARDADLWQVTVAVAAVGCACVLWWWYRTPRGIQWRLAGRAQPAAVLIGVNPLRIACSAGAAMGLLAAIAGVGYVLGMGYIHPDDLGINLSLAALCIALAARPRWLVLDVVVLGMVLFGLREFMRVFEFGTTVRFACFDVLVGAILVGIAIRLHGPGSGV